MQPGDKLGPYQVLSLIGKGGMGEVYRARDTDLKRDVALKVLPAAVSADPEILARFQREAEVLASLDHPNIGPIFGLAQSPTARALVLALIEGPTLADRIAAGPLPLEEALAIARQIVDALEYAHDRGVIHRDLKPANVKVTPDGAVKVLDFGLAKVLEIERPQPSSVNSPTLTLGHTLAGMLLGTAAYMSPEQAVGKPADRRSDIFSFGAVLLEMLTGKRAFNGATSPEVLIAVVKDEPDWSLLPDSTPSRLRALLQRCLVKDRKQRLQAIGEARIVLEKPLEDPPAPAVPTQPSAPSRSRFGWVLAAVFALAAAGLGFVAYSHASEEAPHVAKLFFPPPEKGEFGVNNGPNLAVSPDGKRIVFQAQVDGKRALWIRDLDSLTSRMLPGTENGGVSFWAPDSRRLGFFAGGKLKKIDVTGGPTMTLCDAVNSNGSGTWNQDDVIVFTSTGRVLARVPAAGGVPSPLTELDPSRQETTHYAQGFLPDGHHFLFTAYSGSDSEKTAVYVGDLASKDRKQILAWNAKATYVAPGRLLFFRDQTLMAQPFDLGKLETRGDAVPVAEQVDGFFSASQNGVLAYTAGATGSGIQITWFDRTGKKLDTAGAPGDLEAFALSPDGGSLVVTRRDTQSRQFDLWVRDLARGFESRLTSTGSSRYPAWSADGARIAFLGSRDGPEKLYQKAANGTGPEEVLEDAYKSAEDFSRDGRYLLADTPGGYPKTGHDVWVFPLSGNRKPIPYLQTQFSERFPRLSPDGRWLAYQSNESKRIEIYVVSFPTPGGKWPVSTTGGSNPVWSQDGRELYYYSADGKIMAAEIKPGAQFQAGVPKPLFEVRMATGSTNFAVSKDGRFLLPVLLEQSASVPMTVVLNWPELLKR